MGASVMPTLFSPIKLSPQISLAHRIVMAPLTRNRAVQPPNIPNSLMGQYYEQRANEGGLIITEGTAISKYAYGYSSVPGIYTDEMEQEWAKIVKRVHAKKGLFFMQL